ncbi:MAG TPA: hypothetical protein VIL20_15195 [Sandaracinaceae bacterium]
MDNTPPRNRLIALYTALAVVTLLALKPAFDAYFDRMWVSARTRGLEIGQDLAPLERARAEWARRDEAIRSAMRELSNRGRLGVPAIAPRLDDANRDALRGWAQLPPVRPDLLSPEASARPDEGTEAAPAEGAPAEGAEAAAAEGGGTGAGEAAQGAEPATAPAAAE